ncbi:MAG: hypothetical protein DSM106950_32865 [Stigonema ocellatum SAG 48.90 = DSM 106950]|nr:hypothetical protein [Stigonema ocellatum SAG 48.90 = DSM 106950]
MGNGEWGMGSGEWGNGELEVGVRSYYLPKLPCTRCSPTPYSPLPTPHSPLPTPHSLLPTPHSPLPAPHSPLPTPHSKLCLTKNILPTHPAARAIKLMITTVL